MPLAPPGLRGLVRLASGCAPPAPASKRGLLLQHVTPPRRVCCVACSADFSQLVTASSDGTAKVWNFATGQIIRTLR